MARTEIPINEKLLRQTIEEAEQNGPLRNHDALFVTVAERMQALGEARITKSIVKLRIEKLQIPIKTTKGKHRETSERSTDHSARWPTPVRVPDAIVRPANVSLTNFAEIEKEVRHGFGKWLTAAKNGDLQALINLKCADCVCGQVEEIRNCSVKACPLWSVRPVQNND